MKKCVDILSTEVFQQKALYERAMPEDVESAKIKLLKRLKNKGFSSLCKLASVFSIVDNYHKKSISFNEFKKGI